MKRTVTAVLLFGLAFGYLEAAVVSYLRMIHQPIVERFYPGRPPGDLFPLITLKQARAVPGLPHTIAVEVGREAATLIMLAAIALAVAHNAGEWAATFAIAFGAWDISFYIFLKVLLDWPASLFTWDILFLVPVPWAGPVLAPVIVSLSMIAAGIWHLRRPGSPRLAHWAGIAFGAAVIILSFTLDYRNLMAGGVPRPFPWPVFAIGEGIGLASYALFVVQSRQRIRL